jgi:rhodanese-related sulfurtransferase
VAEREPWELTLCVPKPACPGCLDVDCAGAWSACGADCRKGFEVAAPQSGHGRPCTARAGAGAACYPGDGACPLPPRNLKCRAGGARCPILVDVRTEAEWAAGHVSSGCAVRLPVQDDPSLGATVLALARGDASAPVVTYCHSGVRSAVAQRILRATGLLNVVNGGGYIQPPANAAMLEAMCECDFSCPTSTAASSSACPGDVDGDGVVDVADLLLVLASFGQMASHFERLHADLDDNAVVDVADILGVLALFGESC